MSKNLKRDKILTILLIENRLHLTRKHRILIRQQETVSNNSDGGKNSQSWNPN